ncbi:MAG: hypothetical protein ACLVJ6_00570 [Merdibacter sp.]
MIVKPDTGVGLRTYRISDAQELSAFYAHQPSIPYIMEEFIPGVIISYDGIMNAEKRSSLTPRTSFRHRSWTSSIPRTISCITAPSRSIQS